jgi:hypothetical protein
MYAGGRTNAMNSSSVHLLSTDLAEFTVIAF